MERFHVVKDKIWGHYGMITEVYQNWDDMAKKTKFITMTVQDWIQCQIIPVTEKQMASKWYSVKCFDGGSFILREEHLEPISPSLN